MPRMCVTEKRYRILDGGKVIENDIFDRKMAINHIIYKVKELVDDCIATGMVKEEDAEEVMKNRLKSWTIEEYDIVVF